MQIRFLPIILVTSVLNVFSLSTNALEFVHNSGEWIAQLSYSEQILRKEGTLEEGDTVLAEDGSLYDTYLFEGRAGQAISIIITSEDFDTYLILIDPDEQVIAKNDDFTSNDLNSALLLVLPSSGTYQVLVNSFNDTGRGRYVLSVTTIPETDTPSPSATP
jgi:Cys-tRNA synthase (O-phospho-L-seryl-tRNA:Cys-tRNA synthase)